MNKRRLIPLIAILVLGSTHTVASGTTTSKPNIVIILADDLGWSDLQCYGSRFHETPNIDALASSGVRFTDAYAACHVCSPTRASILTGKYPARLHLTDWLPGRKDHSFQSLLAPNYLQHLPHEEVTLAETLRDHGYRTAHIGKWHLGEEPFGPSSQGFDLQIPRWNKGWPKNGFHAPFGMDGIEDKPGDYLTDRLTDEAERFIDTNRDHPFFLYFSHFAVHDPIEGRDDFVEHFRIKEAEITESPGVPYLIESNPDDSPALTRTQLDEMSKRPAWAGYKVLPNRSVKIKQYQDNIQFAAMVSALDESVGRILDQLQRLELNDNTIIVFLSDNGGMSAANFGNPTRTIGKNQLDSAYATSNLPLRGSKGWLYEGGIRVPLIIRLPIGRAESMICYEPVISTDIYPTLLELAGIPSLTTQPRDGISLASILFGDSDALNREAIYWHFPHYSNHGMQSPGAAVRKGDYKLIEYFENGTIELFNLKNDLGEQHDLSTIEPTIAMELRARLHRWQTEVGAQTMTRKP